MPYFSCRACGFTVSSTNRRLHGVRPGVSARRG